MLVDNRLVLFSALSNVGDSLCSIKIFPENMCITIADNSENFGI